MKVKELVELLKTLDQNATVVLSKDPEGNAFYTWDGHSEGYCRDSDDSYETEVYSAEDLDEDYIEQDGMKPCVVLWP